MKWDFTRRFGFLVNDVAKLYGEQFDRLARERIGLSRAQCRLLGVLAAHGDDQPLSQVELAHRMDLTPMAVGGLCDRMAAAGWIRRQPSAHDRRANEVSLEPSARKALGVAVKLGDNLSDRALSVLSSQEREQLHSMLARVRIHLLAGAPAGEENA